MALNFPSNPADGDIYVHTTTGKKRYFVYSSVQRKWTQIVITSEQQTIADYTPPTNISELINDGIFFSELSTSLIVDALGFIPRSVEQSTRMLSVESYADLSRSSVITPGVLSFVEDTKDVYVAVGTPVLSVPQTRYDNLTPGETFSFDVSFIDVWTKISTYREDESGQSLPLNINIVAEETGDSTVCTITRSNNTFTVTANEIPVNGFKRLNLSLEIAGQTLTTSVDFAFGVSYFLNADSLSANEGDVVTVRLITVGVPDGLEIPYTIQGISLEDTNLDSLTGSFVINQNFFSVLSFTVSNDFITEGPETFALALDNGEASIQITIADTSTQPTYELTVEPSSANEGNTVTFTLNTTQVADNTFIPYTITGSGITAADFGSNSLQDSFLIVDGTGSVTLTIREDLKTEGVETFALSLNIAPISQSVIINDTSIDPPPVFQLLSTRNTINEGESLTITLNSQYSPIGNTIPYTITGIDANDLLVGYITGSFLIQDAGGDRQGTATLNFTFTEDLKTEGTETFTLTLDNGSTFINIPISDTSVAPTFSLSPTSANVDEGETITITLTTDAEDNYSVPYTITGIDVNDTTLDSLTGEFNPISGTATLEFTIINDGSYLEGNETFVLTLDDDAAVGTTLFIGDTSFVVPEFTLSTNDVQHTRANITKTITLTTTLVEDGATIPYTITGLDSNDLESGSLTGSFTINSNTGTIDIQMSDLVDDDKTYTLTLDNGQDSITIVYDSSPVFTYDYSTFTFLTGNTAYISTSLNTFLNTYYDTDTYPWLLNSDYYDNDGNYDNSLGSASRYQIWTVPATATYRIEVYGASGGSAYLANTTTVNRGGRGADISAEFRLLAGDKLSMIAGSRGRNNPRNTRAGSGGGASFVYNITQESLLIVAGAGGGAGNYAYDQIDANYLGTNGHDGQSTAGVGGVGGVDGNGGGASLYGGGGGGWESIGGQAQYASYGAGGQLKLNPFGGSHYSGGSTTRDWDYSSDNDSFNNTGKPGGYGGGGGSYAGGGGGAGYSGGGGGAWSLSGSGGGGGSYVDDSAQNVVRSLSTIDQANGYVIITVL